MNLFKNYILNLFKNFVSLINGNILHFRSIIPVEAVINVILVKNIGILCKSGNIHITNQAIFLTIERLHTHNTTLAVLTTMLNSNTALNPIVIKIIFWEEFLEHVKHLTVFIVVLRVNLSLFTTTLFFFLLVDFLFRLFSLFVSILIRLFSRLFFFLFSLFSGFLFSLFILCRFFFFLRFRLIILLVFIVTVHRFSGTNGFTNVIVLHLLGNFNIKFMLLNVSLQLTSIHVVKFVTALFNIFFILRFIISIFILRFIISIFILNFLCEFVVFILLRIFFAVDNQCFSNVN